MLLRASPKIHPNHTWIRIKLDTDRIQDETTSPPEAKIALNVPDPEKSSPAGDQSPGSEPENQQYSRQVLDTTEEGTSR